MQIDISDNINKFTKNLDYVQKAQIPFATSMALNNISYKVAADRKNPKSLRKSADRRFDPLATDFTKQGFRYKKATKKNMKSVIYILPKQAEYMKFMVSGGVRFPKKRKVKVPTKQIKLNKFGNICFLTSSFWDQVLRLR